MEFWKKQEGKLIAGVVIVAVLIGTFYFGGNAPGSKGWSVDSPAAAESDEVVSVPVEEEDASSLQNTISTTSDDETGVKTTASSEPLSESQNDVVDPVNEQENSQLSEEPAMEINPETGKDQYHTDPVPEGKPVPVEPQDAEIGEKTYTCMFSISCATILDNMDWLAEEKVELVPTDGWLLPAKLVSFREGESVFDVLLRITQEEKIHMEYTNTPMYNSAYIEGIGNLYEFDCGELSGWMYKVNDWFPNYGCSRYQLQDGDVVEWVYTCDLGKDVGDDYMALN